MKTKLKVLMVFTILFLVSTLASVMSVTAVKTGGGKEDNILIVKAHLTAEGPDYFDEGARVEIAANIYYEPFISSGLDKASFKKIAVDGDGEDIKMLCHAELKDGTAGWLPEYLDPISGNTWLSIWFISGYGVVKTLSGKESDVFIGILFCFGGTEGIYVPWAWAGFYDGEWANIIGPVGSSDQLGTITFYPEIEEIGLDRYYA